MPTVAIIGAGDTGGATAGALAAAGGAARVLLVDEAPGMAAGKALDIRQAGAITRAGARVEGTDTIADARGCDVCVVADSARGPAGASLLARLVHVAGSVGAAPLVFAAADQQAALEVAAVNLALPWRRLVGAGGVAMTAAATAMVAMEAERSPREVSLLVLGAPDGGFVVPWGQAALGGMALDEALAPPRLRRLDARVARLWPPGAHTLGAAAARVVRALVTSSRETLPVLTLLDGVFGVRGRPGIVPARLAPGGIARVVEPPLTPRDLTALHTALRW